MLLAACRELPDHRPPRATCLGLPVARVTSAKPHSPLAAGSFHLNGNTSHPTGPSLTQPRPLVCLQPQCHHLLHTGTRHRAHTRPSPAPQPPPFRCCFGSRLSFRTRVAANSPMVFPSWSSGFTKPPETQQQPGHPHPIQNTEWTLWPIASSLRRHAGEKMATNQTIKSSASVCLFLLIYLGGAE